MFTVLSFGHLYSVILIRSSWLASNISMILNKILIQWFQFDVTTTAYQNDVLDKIQIESTRKNRANLIPFHEDDSKFK